LTHSSKSLGGCLAIAASLSALLGVGNAEAATVALGQPCYVATDIGKGAAIAVSGTGYTPGEAVFAQIPAPSGLLSFVEATVGPDGTFTATLPDVSPESIDPLAEKETMQIKGVLSNAILAEAPFELTNLAVKTNPAAAKPNKKVVYSFAGFTPGKPIYGHYVHRGRVALTYRFGTAQGACGLLKAKAKIYPGKSRYTSYAVQFDDSKKYSKASAPKFQTSVTVLHL
jgi:hypothetical protein